MSESLLGSLKISLPLTVMVSMFAQGLSITPVQLTFFKQRPLLLLRSLVLFCDGAGCRGVPRHRSPPRSA